MEKQIEELRGKLIADRDRYLALHHQAVGALQLIEHLMQSDALTVEQAEDLVGAKFENIEELDGKNETAIG